MIFFTTACPDTIRTLPALQHDPDKIEDVDTDSEDHAGDETRYACAARPWVREAPEKKPRKFQNSTDLSVQEIIARHRKSRRGDG